MPPYIQPLNRKYETKKVSWCGVKSDFSDSMNKHYVEHTLGKD